MRTRRRSAGSIRRTRRREPRTASRASRHRTDPGCHLDLPRHVWSAKDERALLDAQRLLVGPSGRRRRRSDGAGLAVRDRCRAGRRCLVDRVERVRTTARRTPATGSPASARARLNEPPNLRAARRPDDAATRSATTPSRRASRSPPTASRGSSRPTRATRATGSARAGGRGYDGVLGAVRGPSPCSGSFTGRRSTDVAVAADGSVWYTNEIKRTIGAARPRRHGDGVHAGDAWSGARPRARPHAIAAAPRRNIWLAVCGSFGGRAPTRSCASSQSTPARATVYELGAANRRYDVAPDTARATSGSPARRAAGAAARSGASRGVAAADPTPARPVTAAATTAGRQPPATPPAPTSRSRRSRSATASVSDPTVQGRLDHRQPDLRRPAAGPVQPRLPDPDARVRDRLPEHQGYIRRKPRS